MTRLKKAAVIGTMVLTLAATSVTAFAAVYDSPADVVADLTGKTVESVITERRETGKTFGEIANEAGKLDEFKDEILEAKKAVLAERVAAGTLTQEEADKIIAALEENQAICDGTGSAGIGRNMGAGFGRGNGCGLGLSQGNRQGLGQGAGFGRMNGNGRGMGRAF